MGALVLLIPFFAIVIAIACGIFLSRKVYKQLKETGETKALISAIFVFVGSAGIILLTISYIIASNVDFGR